MNTSILNTPTLETQRLILRKFMQADIEALYQILADKDVNKFLPWEPLKSIDEAKRFYEERYGQIITDPRLMLMRSV